MPKIQKSQLIELISPGVAGGNQATKIQFNDQPYLRSKVIQSLEIITSDDMSKSPTNNTPISAAQMQTAYLTLYLNDPSNPKNVGEWLQNIPFTIMHRIQNATPSPFVRQLFELEGMVIYWEKCYITLAAPYANTANVSFLINVTFKG